MEKRKEVKQGAELTAEGMKLTSILTGVSTVVSVIVNPKNFFPFWGKPSLSFFFLFLTVIFLFNYWLLKRKAKKEKKGKKGGFDVWGQMSGKELRRLALAVFFMFSIIGPLTIFMEHTIADITILQVAISTIFSGMLSASIILFGRQKYLLVLFLLVSSLGIRYSGRIEEAIGGYSVQSRYKLPDTVTLTAERLQDLQDSQVNLGVFTIFLLVSGYITFILVIGVEGKKRTRLETEIQVAAKLQTMVNMPKEERNSVYTISSRTLPAADVAGDYVDSFTISPTEQIAVIGDASGHGIGAGILAAMTKSTIKTAVALKSSVPDILDTVNNTLIGIVGREKFLTMGMVKADGENKTVTFATAGHLPIIFIHENDLQFIRTPALGLGLQKSAKYQALTYQYSPGDSIILYTDGIIEAANPDGEQFGMERFQELIINNQAQHQQLCDIIIEKVNAFTAKKALADDISIMHIRLL